MLNIINYSSSLDKVAYVTSNRNILTLLNYLNEGDITDLRPSNALLFIFPPSLRYLLSIINFLENEEDRLDSSPLIISSRANSINKEPLANLHRALLENYKNLLELSEVSLGIKLPLNFFKLTLEEKYDLSFQSFKYFNDSEDFKFISLTRSRVEAALFLSERLGLNPKYFSLIDTALDKWKPSGTDAI